MQALEYVAVTREADGIAIVAMNRPEKRNALSVAMMEELEKTLWSLGGDANVGVIILRGEGPAFSAGHDLSELIGRDEAAYRAVFEACVDLMSTIAAVRQPVIAEVERVATAAGCQLVAACDLAVAASTATFATPGVRIGLFCSTPMVALVRDVGRKRAMEMLLTGEPIDAETARAWGLVNRVVAPERLHEATMALARKIAEASRTVVGIGKAAFYAGVDLDTARAYEHAKEVMTANAQVDDAQEGMRAFLEKRRPGWKA
ncbi:MAG: enoyl-CoA hydratase [Candidatus Eremiobacteraeota bacterium]|nr:enoyl-CoA hydratase [Candidatus Eremiobacteraeota bacterium]